MKIKNILIYIIFGVIIILFGLYSYYLNSKIINYKEIIKESENLSSNINKKDNNQKQEYDCSFTETWRIVNTLDSYIAEISELSYIVVDKFQNNSAYSYHIPTDLKNSLEEGKYYEFTYHLKGKGIINDMEDVYSYMIKTATKNVNESEIKVTLIIKETDKVGLAQLNEPICE